MAKIELDDTVGGYNISVINENFQKIEDELNNKVLYRDNPDGEANQLNSNIDVNGKRLYNLPTPTLPSQAARLQDVQDAIAGIVPANMVPFSPYGSLVSENVQGAIQELEDKTTYSAFIDSVLDDTSAEEARATLGVMSSAQVQYRGVSVKDAPYNAVGDGVTDDTAAINSAISAVGAAGGGIVFFPKGTYLLSNTNSGAVSWDNYRALYVSSSNVHLLGAGRGAVTLKLAANADCHVIKFGSRVTETVTVSDCSVQGLTIDGNRANQVTPTDADDHQQGIDISSGCSRITLRDLYIKETIYYGIGGQRTNIKNCLIENVVIENTGADGIDWKNDDGDGRGNVFRDITIINPGLVSALSTAQAGLDLRSGCYFENVTIYTLTAEADLVALRINVDANSTESTLPTYPTSGSNVVLVGNDGASSIGARIAVRNTTIEALTARAFQQGARISAADVKLIAPDLHANLYGVFFTAGSTAEADTCQIIGGTVRDNTTAGIVYDSVDEISVLGVDVRGNGIGHDVRSGSSNVRIIGGSCSGNTTQVTDNGTSTIIQHVSGFRTTNVVSGTGAIDSTGLKTVTIAHGLPFTPNVRDVQVHFERNTNVGDWVSGYLNVVSTDATNVTAQFRVTTASATAGALVTVVAVINSKAVP